MDIMGKSKQISGQINIFDYLKELETPLCNHSGHKCNKKELWKVADTLDDLMCPHVCCRSCATKMCGVRCNGSEEPQKDILECDGCIYDVKGCCNYDGTPDDYCVLGNKAIYPVDIRGLCDDAYCPVCGDGIDELNWMDCERCPSCGARISWEPWHRKNDKENQELFGENWRDRFGKMLKKTKEE